MELFGVFLLFLSFASTQASVSFTPTETNATNCACGFFDPSTKNLFTEATIVYFNETSLFPQEDFEILEWVNPYEKGYNAQYRTAGTRSNVQFNSSISPGLTLYIDPTTDDHVVVGAGFQTRRRDIRYGSFSASIRPPPNGTWAGGSALSMWQYFNETQNIKMDVMNTEKTHNAWTTNLFANEWHELYYGINFTALEKGPVENGTTDPWDFTQWRFDWKHDVLSYYAGLNVTRNATRSHYGDELPTTPGPIIFKHWSTGDKYLMGKPPQYHRSYASIEYIRMFYNSSVTTEHQREEFNKQCTKEDACRIDDTTLRGSTTFSEASLETWVPDPVNDPRRIPAIVLCCLCVAFGLLLLSHSAIRRTPWFQTQANHGPVHSIPQPEQHVDQYHDPPYLGPPSIPPSTSGFFNSQAPTLHSGRGTPALVTGPPSDDMTISRADMAFNRSEVVSDGSLTDVSTFHPSTTRLNSMNTYASGTTTPTFAHLSRIGSSEIVVERNSTAGIVTVREDDVDGIKPVPKSDETKVTAKPVTTSAGKVVGVDTTEVAPAPAKPNQPLQANKRVDYLAGIVALCSILVTIVHFFLTFIPAIISPTADTHYGSERWAEKTIVPFVLSFWIGIFFTTTSRFLVSNYLRNGDLANVAQKAVGRTFRLGTPVAALALFQYFIIDSGAVKWAEYVPSISWTTWIYVVGFDSFGAFLSEVLELFYLIPNAAPQITNNYCTGVLWTIPVQLQGSWLVLCGVVMTREAIKPWKRICLYLFIIIMHWYAHSWGAYLWYGVFLADLDVSYKYRKWLYARPRVYYPVLWCTIAVFLCAPAAELLTQWTDFSLSVSENGIHPDPYTGLPIKDTVHAGYPDYFYPRMSGFFFAAGLQTLVDLSTVMQKFMSLKVLVWVHPHIFTIYLCHGMAFWSLGAFVFVKCSELGMSYWSKCLVTGICSYALLLVALPIVSPILDVLGKTLTALVWQFASQEQPAQQPTLYPFSKEIIEPSRPSPNTSSETLAARSGSESEGKDVKEKKDGKDERDSNLF
jgi:hypothetical protein